MIRRAVVLAFCVAGAAPCALRAQQSGTSESSTSFAVEASYRLSRLQGESARMLGGAALFTIDDRYAFGLAGWSLFSPTTLRRPGSALDFGFAYGGVVVEMRLARRRKARVAARLLVGAGNGKLSLPLVGTELDSDNFGVMEPEILGTLDLFRPLRLTAGLGYRAVYGVQDLPGITQSDLRGWTTRLSLSLHTF